MNNILSFNEYNGQEIQQIETALYEQMLYEKSSLNSGIRGFFNRRAAGRVKEELEEEIEMSKTIMDGIQKGLESLNDNFDVIKKNIADKENNDSKKGEKQKALDEIIKLIETSRKNTWDIHELIDEGEIDYAGFTANIGISSVAYFGILLTPFRAAVMIHKGYNYFFNIVKNTIRKALVMLQLNFDQFENLIITKGFQSADFIQTMDTNEKITEFYMQLETEFVGKGGVIKGKQADKLKHKLQLARDKAKQMRDGEKIAQQNENAFNCLDQYNNTYTRSLETLRQYSQDDVQKHLDSIKTSMSKLAGQDVDLQIFSELIIAAAEEHAYKVSSSIYNKFATMTEVFSLPNQKKLIELIVEANKEERTAAKKARNEKKEEAKKLQEKLDADKTEEDGLKVFKSLSGVSIGEMDEESRIYDKSKIEGADKWTYDEFKKLSEEDQESFDTWLQIHNEVLEKCHPTLQVSVTSAYNYGYLEYVDTLIDYIGPCIEEIDESYIILNFDEYNLSEGKVTLSDIEDDVKNEIKDNIKAAGRSYYDFRDSMFGKDHKFVENDISTLENCITVLSEDDEYKEKKDGKMVIKDIYTSWINNLNICLKKAKRGNRKTVKIDFSEISKKQKEDLKTLYVEDDKRKIRGDDMKKIAIAAIEAIGNKLLKDNTFVKNAEEIVDVICNCLSSDTVSVSPVTYKILTESIAKLKELRDNDYFDAEKESKENAKKSEK